MTHDSSIKAEVSGDMIIDPVIFLIRAHAPLWIRREKSGTKNSQLQNKSQREHGSEIDIAWLLMVIFLMPGLRID